MQVKQILLAVIVSAPLLYMTVAIAAFFQPGLRPKFIKTFVNVTSVYAIFTGLLAIYLAIANGLTESLHWGIAHLGLSIRIDPLSTIMFVMISLLAFIIVRFSNNYLDGDNRQGVFIGRLASTISSVMFLVIAGNLLFIFTAWTVTSFTLHNLLVFYRHRKTAIAAARKKFIVGRLSDIFLAVSFILLYSEFGTGNLEIIFTSLSSGGAANAFFDTNVELSAIFLVLAVVFKSAQFPTHGWLVEVMETPTPVSALLHAGLLNAGPFLITRMAFIMHHTIAAPALLILFAGTTAIFASIVFLTQPSIKVSLGYSSAAHMGFSLMMCGMGIYAAAMLHMVAHSFYKAHAFLSSGSAVDQRHSSGIELPKRLGSPWRIVISIAIALTVYVASAFAWGIDPIGEMALMATGAIMVMGLTQLIAPAIDSKGSGRAFLQVTLMAVGVASAFFALEAGSHLLLGTQVPDLIQPSIWVMILINLILLVFGAVIIIQILNAVLPDSPKRRKLAIHFRNGWYVNAWFDRIVGTYHRHG